MKPLILQPTPRFWTCPLCGGQHRTTMAEPHTPFHSCRAMGMASIPFIEAPDADRVRIRMIEREDYLGDTRPGDIMSVDGRPLMAVSVDRPDGSNDLAVYAPTARSTSSALSNQE